MIRIAIFHPTDPVGHVPGGIDTFIKGMLSRAPADMEYVLYGATSDPIGRPLGIPVLIPSGSRDASYIPIVSTRSSSSRGGIPLSVRYLWALRSRRWKNTLSRFDILDFHRIEPVLIFGNDARPKNIFLHGDYAELRDKKSDIMWRHWPWLYEQLEAHAFQSLDRIYAVRQSAVERYKATFPATADKFTFTPTWFDTRVFFPSNREHQNQIRKRLLEPLKIGHATRVLTFVGRLDHQKDPLMLVKAFGIAVSRTQDLHLIIIGDGILKSVVEEALKSEGLGERVSILGVRSSAEIADFLRVSDIFVLPSAYEGMPIAVLEALATGVPVVSTAVGEVPNILKSGTSGQISDDRSPESFARAIRLVLDGLERMRGEPCQAAAAPYRPERVLAPIYDNHRAQHERASAK